ncbi:hypothetical protein D3C73_1030530 [compost metagenome]
MPSNRAHSPIANIAGSLVCIFSSTTIPPRGPTSIPQAFASSSRGLIPADITSMSASNTVSSVNFNAVILPSPSILEVFLFKWICKPRSVNFDFSISLPAASICLGIRRGANSMILVLSIPKSISAFAASKPSKPPPITEAVFAFFAYSLIRSRSSRVR